MTKRPRKPLAILGLILSILALLLVIVGLFLRFSGTGNPVGVIYIYVGIILAMGGWIATLFASRKGNK